MKLYAYINKFFGGLSSTIAGGNFWKGFRQGVITSGLNHGIHSAFEASGESDTATKADRDRFKETREEYYRLMKNSQTEEALYLIKDVFHLDAGIENHFSDFMIYNDKENFFVTHTGTQGGRSYIEIHGGILSHFGDATRALYHEFVHVYQHHELKNNWIFNEHYVREYDAYHKTINNKNLPRSSADWTNNKIKAWNLIPQHYQKAYKNYIKNNPYVY